MPHACASSSSASTLGEATAAAVNVRMASSTTRRRRGSTGLTVSDAGFDPGEQGGLVGFGEGCDQRIQLTVEHT
jgi:hypothetical protein